MMTEDEAKTKWCAHARTAMVSSRASYPSFNRVGTGDKETIFRTNMDGCQCIASECMAWRWTDSKPKITHEIWPSNAEDRARVRSQEEERLSRAQADRRGCCGLAGGQS